VNYRNFIGQRKFLDNRFTNRVHKYVLITPKILGCRMRCSISHGVFPNDYETILVPVSTPMESTIMDTTSPFETTISAARTTPTKASTTTTTTPTTTPTTTQTLRPPTTPQMNRICVTKTIRNGNIHTTITTCRNHINGQSIGKSPSTTSITTTTTPATTPQNAERCVTEKRTESIVNGSRRTTITKCTGFTKSRTQISNRINRGHFGKTFENFGYFGIENNACQSTVCHSRIETGTNVDTSDFERRFEFPNSRRTETDNNGNFGAP